MGLPRAIHEHAAKNLYEAEKQYQRAYDQGDRSAVLFQNYGALLRNIDKIDAAEKLFVEGLKLHPNEASIYQNYANLLKNKRPSSSILYYLHAIRLQFHSENPDPNRCLSLICDVLTVSRSLKLYNLSIEMVSQALSLFGSNPGILHNILLLTDYLCDESDCYSRELWAAVRTSVDNLLSQCTVNERAEIFYALAAHFQALGKHKDALLYFDDASKMIQDAIPSATPEDYLKLEQTYSINSWNFSNTLLKMGDFKRGWELFDFGLRTPADGKQKWQRALLKPFSNNILQVWDGKHSLQSRILLLEEQAVGDVMMFLTMLPSILEKFASVGIFLTPRLKSIYKRSFRSYISSGKLSLYTKSDLESGKLDPRNYDYQCPIGSVYKYFFTSIDLYAPKSPILFADKHHSDILRRDYLAGSESTLVGISWSGGGRGARIRQKSVPTDLFKELLRDLQAHNCKFVNLQYGDHSATLDAWANENIHIIKDKRVYPIKNNEYWLSQVDACDYVISIANTTIHGAGGLGKPTMCLLSCFSDWRWLDDETASNSYWYPSVSVARQSRNRQWAEALDKTKHWLLPHLS